MKAGNTVSNSHDIYALKDTLNAMKRAKVCLKEK
jgi:hypothetical protein